MNYTLAEKVSKVVEEKNNAIKALESINFDLSNEENVDSSWIRDSIELNSGLSIIERANFNIEIKKLKQEIEKLTIEACEAEREKEYAIGKVNKLEKELEFKDKY